MKSHSNEGLAMFGYLIPFFLLIPVWAQQFPEPTRPIDIYNPFGTTTTPRPPGKGIADNEVIVRISTLGDIVGRKVKLTDLPWTPEEDPLEQIPPFRDRLEPNPLPKNNTVTVFTFLGVPYAEPPIGERRFKPPQQLLQFPGTSPYLAFSWGASCPQDVENSPKDTMRELYPFSVNEDCLYLNIFTPDVSKSSGRHYPVVVFLHGGNFQTGSANEWPGYGLASRGVVVVTVNYRLGAFGFMSLGDTNANFGLQDQRTALIWVRDYISSFGGDPQAVTLVGHDAGGVSVGLHMLSPLSKNLFRSASSMSGSEVSYHSLIGKPALAFNNTLKLGRYLGCTQALPSNVWDCILTRSTDDIIRATESIPIEYNRYLFMPTIDGVNVLANPLWTLNNIPNPTVGAIYPSPVPYLTGMNAQDGSEVILEDRYLGEYNQFNNVDEEYMKSFAIEYAFRHNYTMNKEAIAEAIISRYQFWPDRANEWMKREKFIELTTDCYYTAPIALSAHLHSAAGSRTFMYVNNYNFSRDNDALRFIPNWMAVCRECDLYLLFNYAFLPPDLRPQSLKNATFTDTDRNASQLFSTLYRRFAYHQNPNLLYDGSWPALEPRGHWYMNFNYSKQDEMTAPGKIDRDYRYEDVAFWNEYIPQLVNYMTTTFPPEEVSVRRELMTFQWIVGILVLLLIIFIVLTGTFAYKVCEGNHYEERELMQLVNVKSDAQSQSTVYSPPKHRGPPTSHLSSM